MIIISLAAFSQTESKKLSVYSISEFSDGYMIRGIDSLKGDTLIVISKTGKPKHMKGYRKIEVGGRYTFKVDDVGKQFAAMPPSNFVIRIKNTVVWKYGDRVKDMPVFATNTKGLFIRME